MEPAYTPKNPSASVDKYPRDLPKSIPGVCVPDLKKDGDCLLEIHAPPLTGIPRLVSRNKIKGASDPVVELRHDPGHSAEGFQLRQEFGREGRLFLVLLSHQGDSDGDGRPLPRPAVLIARCLWAAEQ